ncbi:MAG: hypothetical protein CME63_10585 [Halobacteriovoraceae bacterium]|nr:hypothetical protein [Halobacteriovoraceae bacterium]|tara:strand:+ start:80746 stop:82290 length:1545 start_codon:yes stop_codon:yes gene_type:complete
MKKLEHITFIVPPKLTTFENSLYIGRLGGPPLNIAYLASITEDEGVSYQVIDGLESSKSKPFEPYPQYYIQGLFIHEIVEQISNETDVIAITSMFTSEWLIVREILKEVEAKFPDKLVIMGGEHASADARQILRFEPAVDAIFRGESEVSYREFLVKYTEKKDFKNIPGVMYKIDKEIIRENPKAPRITNIDEIKPSWKKINVNYYLDNKLSYSELGNRAMPIISSRGCPYQCTFCSNDQMWGTRYVTKSVDKVIEELEYYIKKYKVEHFDFIDLATSVNKKWFKALLTKMIDELPEFSWEMTVGTRSEILDEEILTLLYRSGMRVITYAPETGSKSMAKKIKKRINHDKMYASMRSALKVGLRVKTNIVIGFPNETIRELLATIWMSVRLAIMGIKGVTVAAYQPFLGTELSRELYSEKTYLEYNRRVIQLTAKEGPSVFNLTKLISDPRNQFYYFISNIMMISTFFINCACNPLRIISSIKNIKNGKPIGAVENVTFSLVQKIKNTTLRLNK